MASVAVDNSDVAKRLVIARVGWCNAYRGDPEDPPRDGGSFNKTEVGSEDRNFVSYGDFYYGYARPTGVLTLFRVTGTEAIDAGEEEERVDDVCVAMMAKSLQYGQVLVGWYRHATLYAYQQEHRKRGYYQWVSRLSTSTLLPVNERATAIPKGKGATGQSAFTYSRDKDGYLLKGRPYLAAIRRDILRSSNVSLDRIEVASNEDAIVRGQGFQQDVRYRTEIERHSMKVVKRALRKIYATVTDVSREQSYDYLCTTANKREDKVEVKGTTTAGDSVLVSRLEFDLAKAEPVDLYVLNEINVVEHGEEILVSGGTLAVFKNWSNCALQNKATGYKIILRRSADGI